MNVVKVTQNIPVIPTTQGSQAQGLHDAPKNRPPQPASQRKWDRESRLQAGKFNIPRPSGHEPKAETRFTLPKVEARFTLPKVETRFTLPKTKPFDFRRAGVRSGPTNDWSAMFIELVQDFCYLAHRTGRMGETEKKAEIDAYGEKWGPFFSADWSKFRREDMESTSG